MTKVKAIEDKVFAKEMVIDQKTDGGIVLATDPTQLPQIYGEVLSVGEQVGDKIKVGDIIVFHQRGGQALFMNNKNYRILALNEIYGIMEEENE